MALLALAGLACGSDAPSFDPPETDLGIECDEETTCGRGQVCLSGRCYEACESDAQCAPSETCSSDGVCVSGGTRTDGGSAMTDGGPCAERGCMDGQVCHGPTGLCVQCNVADDCAAAAPICDLARGRCVAFQAGLVCAPCNQNADCPGAGEVCTERLGATERVCLAPCDIMTPCPGGFQCRSGSCEPNLGSCTQLRLGVARTRCAMDTDCVPLGASAAPGTCDARTSQCLYVCSEGFSCPSGFVCDGPTDGFCR